MLVLDCSVTLAWYFEDERTSAAMDVVDHVKSYGAIVPELWWRELTNAFLVAERRNRITEARTQLAFTSLRDLPVLIDELSSADTMFDTLNLGRRYKLTAYDAAYLELALRRHVPLATFDKALVTAATSAGVGLLKL